MVSSRPIKRIQTVEDESGLLLDPREALSELAALTPANILEPEESSQYLTAYLNWRPTGSDPARRPARRQFEDEANALVAEFARRGAVAENLRTDIERIKRYLDGERIDRHIGEIPLPSATQGILVVARAAAGIFAPIPLGVKTTTQVTVGPIPALFELARICEDYEPYAVLVIDQQAAGLTFIGQQRSQREVNVQGASYPFRRIAGGNQRRYQARAGERLDQFARTVADGVRQELDVRGVHVLIVAGDEVAVSPLMTYLHRNVADRVVSTTRLDITTSVNDIIAHTWPIAQEAERQREEEVVRHVRRILSAKGTAVAGVQAVLESLQARRVQQLALVDDFSAPGWADYGARVVGVGSVPEQHPTGGSNYGLVPLEMREELVRRAVSSDAEIEIVQTKDATVEPDLASGTGTFPQTKASEILNKLGGVAALLRY